MANAARRTLLPMIESLRHLAVAVLAFAIVGVPAPAPAASAEDATPRPPAFETSERDLDFVTKDGVIVRGILVVPIPDDGAPRPEAGWPVAVLIHGHTRNRDGLLPLADALATRGIAAAVLDQRGHGASRVTKDQRIYAFPLAPERDLRREVEDQHLLLDQLAGFEDLDLTRLALVGVGIGGLVAAEASWQLPHVRALAIVDVAEPVAGFDPRRDLALYGERPVFFLCSGFPQARARARTLAAYGHGERTVVGLDAYEGIELLIAADQPGLDALVTWLVPRLAASP